MLSEAVFYADSEYHIGFEFETSFDSQNLEKQS